MTPFRPSRERRGPDRLLGLKILLFAVGAAIGVAGMLLDREWLVWIAIAVLAFGALLRFLSDRGD